MSVHLPHNRYVDFFTDFAFKRLFGSEMSKPILLDFLNELLYQEQGRIVSLTYLKSEQLGRSVLDRKAVYDLYCENERGEKFIVELQRTRQKYFKDRSLYYSTFPIVEQAQKGDEWDFKLTPIYVIAILGFVFDEDAHEPEKYRYVVKLADIEAWKVFSNTLTFVYLELPKFTKTEAELTNRFEKWLYVLKNLATLDRIPDSAREKVFEEFFRLAEIAQFTREEHDAYDDSRKIMWDKYSIMKTALEEATAEAKAEGKAEGLAEGKAEGLAEGKAEGKAEGLRVAILALLASRFGPVPPALSDNLSTLHDITALQTLTTEVFKAASLGDFEIRVTALVVQHEAVGY